jgi:pyridoxal 5'-phosphate synthase pdxS subunit
MAFLSARVFSNPATTHYNEPKLLAEISRNLGEPMVGRQVSNIPEQDLLAGRGW